MNVSLTPELEELVASKVRSGFYQTSSEVIREGLRLLKQRDESLDALRREIAIGADEIVGGEFVEYDGRSLGQLTDEVKARGRKRLVSLRGERTRK